MNGQSSGQFRISIFQSMVLLIISLATVNLLIRHARGNFILNGRNTFRYTTGLSETTVCANM